MSIREIALVGDPVLRRRAPECSLEELLSEEVQQLIDDLIETKRAAGGAGLAATQLSQQRRIAVVEVDARTRYDYKPLIPLTVIVNPTVESLTQERISINEGCLSVPNLRGDVERWLAVRVRHLDRAGEPRELVARGLSAGTFQHEVDHLDGVLFLDRVTDPRTFTTWEQFERHHREAFLRRVAPYVRNAG
jgi:peptide deformylase